MTENILTFSPKEKQELARLQSLPGKTIGTGLLEDKKFILTKEGRAGLEKINSALSELGCETFNQINHSGWYPVSCNLISYFLARKLFNWNDETMKEMGKNSPKVSLLMRSMAKYFISAEKLFGTASLYWKKFYDVGALEPIELNMKQKYCLLSLKNFPGSELFCRHLEGVFEIVSSFLNYKKIRCEEIQCLLKGQGESHIFKITWKE